MTIDGNGSSAGEGSNGSGWNKQQEEQDRDSHNQNNEDNDRWRDLCRMVADEKNPARMSALLDELITVLDQRRQRFRQDGPNDDAAVANTHLTPEADEN